MNTIATYLKNDEMQELGPVEESRPIENNRTSVKRGKLTPESRLTVYKLASSLFVVLTGLAGYWIAGL